MKKEWRLWMSLLFELEQHQKLVVYEEGNQILAVRLPLRRGGEFRMRDGWSGQI